MFKKSFLKKVANKEKVARQFLEKQLERGRVVIPLNKNKDIDRPAAIGEGLKIKVNTNLGISTRREDIKAELEKLKIAVEFGTDTVMDLSVGEGVRKVRREIINSSPLPVGTVPVYEAALEAERKRGSIEKLKFDDLWSVLKQQAEDGVDFFTIHAGIVKKSLPLLKNKKRVGGVVSRGGAILARWMYVNKKENLFYEHFDKILTLAKHYNITLSLGDALRPGAIADSTDKLQLQELKLLGKLVKRCRSRGVQAMVEGPGHIRLDEIKFNMLLEKKLCDRAPFYILGPLPTDIASGYDHITSAMGGALAGLWGADFLCVVTPAEHLRHPLREDIKEGVIAAKLAAHSVNLLNFEDERKRDRHLSLYRARRQWEKIFPLTIDEQKAKRYREGSDAPADICTMCGDFCSLKISEKCHLLK